MSHRDQNDARPFVTPSIRETRLIGLPSRRPALGDRIRRDGRDYFITIDDNGRHAHLHPTEELAPEKVASRREISAAVAR